MESDLGLHCLPMTLGENVIKTAQKRANSVFKELILIGKGVRIQNGRVTSPESVPIHLMSNPLYLLTYLPSTTRETITTYLIKY